MDQSLNESLLTVQVLDPTQGSGLRVFGLRWESVSRLRYLTLDEAMRAGSLEVTEVNEVGSVPTLKVINRSDVAAFLMAGEQLIGAKQNRVLNVSMMIPPSSTVMVPVSCVEAGRWNRSSHKFSSGETMSHGIMRKMLSAQTQAGLQNGGTPISDQGLVWGEVSRKLSAMGSASPSSAFDQVYADHGTRLDELVARLHPPEGCHGVVFVVAGQLAGADIFDQPTTLSKLWTKLVRSYALDAMEAGGADAPPVATHDVARWIHAAAGAKAESFPSPGLGRDVRLEASALFGSALVVDDQAVHVELFAEAPPAES